MTVKALFFDVFGTLVDWRTSIAREAEATLKPRGFSIDALAFADAWRGEYQPAMDEVRSGRIPFSRSMCCTGAILNASCRVSAFRASTKTCCATSIWPGTVSMRGRMSHPV